MAMDRIISITGDHLDWLKRVLSEVAQTGNVYQARVCIDDDQVKFKVNERTWTPGLGGLDPASAPAPDPSMVRLKDPRLCPNDWHRTAPIRLVNTCPECPDAEIPGDSEVWLVGQGEGVRDRRTHLRGS